MAEDDEDDEEEEEEEAEEEELICRVQSSSPSLVSILSLKESSLISANPTADH